MDRLRWELIWENDMLPPGHDALSAMLARVFPEHAESFTGGRTWLGVHPELRLIAYLGDRPIAHLGMLRRFLQVQESGASLLIGDVGMVSVDPDFAGGGIGRELLSRTARVLDDLILPFGFLTCHPATIPFYGKGGWIAIEGQTTRMINTSHQLETYTGPVMVLPVRSSIDEWPKGATIDRNGLEV